MRGPARAVPEGTRCDRGATVRTGGPDRGATTRPAVRLPRGHLQLRGLGTKRLTAPFQAPHPDRCQRLPTRGGSTALGARRELEGKRRSSPHRWPGGCGLATACTRLALLNAVLISASSRINVAPLSFSPSQVQRLATGGVMSGTRHRHGARASLTWLVRRRFPDQVDAHPNSEHVGAILRRVGNLSAHRRLTPHRFVKTRPFVPIGLPKERLS